MRATSGVWSACLLFPGIAWAGALEASHERALGAYEQAMEHLGVALGERAEDGSSVRALLTAQVAELTCLRGNREGCLQASAAAGRALGEYTGPLEPAEVPAPGRWSRARTFVLEAYRLSEGWGMDNALASEALGLLARLEGDHHRTLARAAGRARFEGLVARGRKAGPADGLAAWDEAWRVAVLMLDEPRQVLAAEGLAGAVLGLGSAGLPPGVEVAALRRALVGGQDRLAILGRADGGAIARALERVQTRELAAPDLQFDALPRAGHFEVDLALAAAELRELAGRAPLRSRASALLHFFAAYAGTLAGEPGACEPLLALGDVLALTDAYLAARAHGLLGREALLAGDLDRAARLAGEAAERLAPLAGSAAVAGLLQASQAQALFYLGQYPEAAKAFAAAAVRLATRPEGAAQAYLGQAHALVFAGQTQAAETALARAAGLLPRLAAGQRAAIERSARLDRALLSLAAGRGDEATATLRAVAEEARQAGDVRAGAVAHTNLAEVLNDRGEHAAALSSADAALAWLDPASQADAAWQAWTEKGRALAGLGKGAAAQRAFDAAMALVEGLRARIGAEGARRSFANAKARLYRASVALLAELGDHRQAFLVAERARGRAFLDMLAERQLDLGDKQRQARLGPARERMLRALPRPELPLQDPAAELMRGASTARPAPASPDPRADWLGLVVANPAGVDDVRRLLGRDEALLAFFHDGRRLHAFLVHPGGVQHQATEVDEETLQNRVAAMLRLLRDPRSDEAAIRAKGERLLGQTVGALGERLRAFRRWTVVPWGPLHYLPLGALWDGQAYLLDRHELSAAPSAASLVMIRARLLARRGERGARVLALGDPATDLPRLEAARREVGLIGGLFEDAQAEVGGRATKRLFLERAPGARYVHIASHGVFLPTRPMESYLALAGDSPEQGRLHALEVLGVDLRQARLVTLSSCSSGEVQVGQGDEIVGLTRAFLHAGAPALLATLWPVADEAALGLVDRLYRELGRGLAPGAAWTAAARGLKAQPGHAHPFFWAPFQLVGS